MQKDETPLWCDRCAVELHPGAGDFYVVRILAVADPTPPAFSRDDLRKDHQAELTRLIHQLRDQSEQELLDQVYRRVDLFLCVACYRQWIENPLGQ